MKILFKIILLVLLIYCIKYLFDRYNYKKENIGLDNTYIICSICLILILIFF